ncbi:MAG: hypothetical protein NXH75_10955, partial [Halobacteriovoraceae bacterium]|nr:hypothetical protein [Halobacteriovoraceae bacterium]
MKLVILGLLTLTSSMTFALNFTCDNVPTMAQGKAELKGTLNKTKGEIEISGDGVYFNSTKREIVPFARIVRTNEETLKFSKYTGGSLFHRFYFSLPKSALEGQQKSFTGYLTYLREGVAGKENIKLSCSVNQSNEIMTEFINNYNNLISYDRMSEEDKKKINLILTPQDLPKRIYDRLQFLELSILQDWDIVSQGQSFDVVNFSKSEETDAYEVKVDGVIHGYIFNVTECN